MAEGDRLNLALRAQREAAKKVHEAEDLIRVMLAERFAPNCLDFARRYEARVRLEFAQAEDAVRAAFAEQAPA